MEKCLTLVQILKFVDSSIESRCLTEAEQILVSHHLVMCGIKAKKDEEVQIEAACIRSSSVKENPHTINCSLLKKENGWTIKDIECSCKAGKSKSCKHCVAVLLFCNRNDINDMEVLSSTDIKCTWNNFSDKFPSYAHSVPVNDFCHTKTAIVHYSSDSAKEKLKTASLKILPNSMLGKHLTRYEESKNLQCLTSDTSVDEPPRCNITLPRILEKILNSNLEPSLQFDIQVQDLKMEEKSFFLNSVQITNEESARVAVCTVTQNSELWMQERKKRITGSICYELLTYSKNKNAQWDKKIDKILNPCFLGNLATSYGKYYEDVARKEYAKYFKIEIFQCGLIIHPAAPLFGYSPDGLICDDDTKIKLIEIKCPVLGSQKSAVEIVADLEYLTVDSMSRYALKKKHKYYGQIQLGLFLTGAVVCDLIIFSSFDNSFVIIAVDKDFQFIENMISVLCQTYFAFLLPAIIKKK